MKTKVLIADDEELARLRLIRSLQKIDAQVEFEEACNGLEALEKISACAPTVVFLDIEMPGLNGFEVLASLEVRRFHLIFVTAFQEFAIKAFEECALDYVLKPFTDERLQKTWARIKATSPLPEHFAELENKLQSKGQHLARLALKRRGRLDLVDVHEISCILWQEDYSAVYLHSTSEYLTSFSLKYFEEHLDPALFLRVNRNALVAILAILSFHEGTSTLTLQNHMEVQVSRRCKSRLLEMIAVQKC